MAYTPERNSVFETIQIGIETTPGTPATATIKPASISIKPSAKPTISKFQPAGSLTPTIFTIGKDYTVAAIEFKPCYEEIAWIFDGVLNKNVAGVHALNNTTPNTPVTYTVEVGTGGTAQKFSYGVIQSASLKWNPDEFSGSGEMFGTALCAATPATGIVQNDVTPIEPLSCKVTCDTTELTRVFEWDLGISGHWNPIFCADPDAGGAFVAISETSPQMTFSMTCEADTQGMGFLNELRDGNATRSFELLFTNGSDTFKIEFGGKVSEVKEFSDQDGIYAIGYQFTICYDETLSSPIKVTLS